MMLLMPGVVAPRPELGSCQSGVAGPVVPPPPGVATLFQRMPFGFDPPGLPVLPHAGITTAATSASRRPVQVQIPLLDIGLTLPSEASDSNLYGTFSTRFSMRRTSFIGPPRPFPI